MGLCRVFLPLNTASKIAGKIVNWKQVPLFQSSHNEMVNSKTKQQCHFSDDSCGSPDLSRPTSSNPLLGNQRSSCRSRENQVQSICVYIHTHTLPPLPSHAFDSHQAGFVCQLRPAVPHKRARDDLRLLCGVHSQHIPPRHSFPVWGHPKSLWFFPTLPGAFSLYSLQDGWLHKGMQQSLTKISPLHSTRQDGISSKLCSSSACGKLSLLAQITENLCVFT